MTVDRKALIREYKETPRPAGIYRVRNTASGRFFTATSVDLPAALNRQRAQLRMSMHPDKALQADWDELGADAFEFEILDELPPSDAPGYNPAADLEVLEELWEEKLAGETSPRY